MYQKLLAFLISFYYACIKEHPSTTTSLFGQFLATSRTVEILLSWPPEVFVKIQNEDIRTDHILFVKIFVFVLRLKFSAHNKRGYKDSEVHSVKGQPQPVDSGVVRVLWNSESVQSPSGCPVHHFLIN